MPTSLLDVNSLVECRRVLIVEISQVITTSGSAEHVHSLFFPFILRLFMLWVMTRYSLDLTYFSTVVFFFFFFKPVEWSQCCSALSALPCNSMMLSESGIYTNSDNKELCQVHGGVVRAVACIRALPRNPGNSVKVHELWRYGFEHNLKLLFRRPVKSNLCIKSISDISPQLLLNKAEMPKKVIWNLTTLKHQVGLN